VSVIEVRIDMIHEGKREEFVKPYDEVRRPASARMMVSSKVITVQPAPGLAISSRAGDDRQQAATVGFIRDGDHRVTDPGVVRHRSVILDPLDAVGVAAEQVTDVVLSHHHSERRLNDALSPDARVLDHWAIHRGDQWTWRDAEGFQLTSSIKLIRTSSPRHRLHEQSEKRLKGGDARSPRPGRCRREHHRPPATGRRRHRPTGAESPQGNQQPVPTSA
jgi:hypothetical protein